MVESPPIGDGGKSQVLAGVPVKQFSASIGLAGEEHEARASSGAKRRRPAAASPTKMCLAKVPPNECGSISGLAWFKQIRVATSSHVYGRHPPWLGRQ